MRRVWVGVVLLCLSAKGSLGYTVPTHQRLIDASIKQLYRETAHALWQGDVIRAVQYFQAAEFWSGLKEPLKQGAGDIDWRPYLFNPPSWSIHHGWNIGSDAGWFGAVGATAYADMYEAAGIKAYHDEKNNALMAWYVGAALHLVQDLTVPHHEACRIGDGHAEYEHVCERLTAPIATHLGGIYTLPGLSEEDLIYAPASVWIRYAAAESEPAYAVVGPRNELARQSDEAVGTVMLTLASRVGAGYLYSLYRYFASE